MSGPEFSDSCLRCGTFIEQIDETDLRCYPKGEHYRYGRHEFSFKARHRRQERDLDEFEDQMPCAICAK